jgi:Immunoglobulin I-set domain/Immunoglobulin domain
VYRARTSALDLDSTLAQSRRMEANEKRVSSMALVQPIRIGGQRPFRMSMLTSIARTQWFCLLCCVGFSVCFGQSAPNDDFTNAIPLYGNLVTFSGTLSNATIEVGETPSTCYGAAPSVWWLWTATNSTTVLIRPVGPMLDAGFDVCTGTNVSALTELDCNLMYGENQYACFAATAGTTYYIRAEGYSSGSFTLSLNATNSPAILRPPRNQSAAEGESAFFSVLAAGLQPLTYQWQFEGKPLPEQTTPSLVLNYLAVTQAGSYSVVVSNVSGVITSAVANLTILPPNPPDPWDSATCIANLEEINAAIKLWAIEAKKSPSALVTEGDILPYLNTNTHNIVCPIGGTSFADSYALNDVMSVPVCERVPPYHVLSMFPLITGQPQSQTNEAGATVKFLVSATGLEPLVFQWQKNGSNLVDGGNIAGANADTLTLTSISASDAGNYSVIVTNSQIYLTYNSVTSSIAVLTVLSPPTLSLDISAGYPTLQLQGMLSNDFVVQYSTNLADTNWINWLSISNLQSSPYPFEDPAGAGQPMRFYRAFMQ